MKQRIVISLLLVTVLLMCGCAVSSVIRKHPDIAFPGERFIRTELIFGLSKTNGTIITESEWQQFVDENITPQFREGLTVIGAYGQWMMTSGDVVKEPSKIVILLHKQTSETDNKIESIRKDYKKLFQQESVLRITEDVAVSF
ncbi:MAG: DUF3574 domain-containing protein [Desulfobacterales bacterium]|nr:DUF3574 domain-containing protein [Desulfobacterales bacterium]